MSFHGEKMSFILSNIFFSIHTHTTHTHTDTQANNFPVLKARLYISQTMVSTSKQIGYAATWSTHISLCSWPIWSTVFENKLK